MFLRFNTRKKDGKEYRNWSVVENRRLRAGHTIQRTVLHLGENNDTQQTAWRKSLDGNNEVSQRTERICLSPKDRAVPPDVLHGLRVRLSELTLQRPRVSAIAGCHDQMDPPTKAGPDGSYPVFFPGRTVLV